MPSFPRGFEGGGYRLQLGKGTDVKRLIDSKTWRTPNVGFQGECRAAPGLSWSGDQQIKAECGLSGLEQRRGRREDWAKRQCRLGRLTVAPCLGQAPDGTCHRTAGPVGPGLGRMSGHMRHVMRDASSDVRRETRDVTRTSDLRRNITVHQRPKVRSPASIRGANLRADLA